MQRPRRNLARLNLRQSLGRHPFRFVEVTEQRGAPADHAVRVDLFHHVEPVLEGQPLPRVLASSAPVVLDLAGSGQRVERHALQVGVIQVAGHVQRLLGAPSGRGDLFC